jgi:hypothetical protein
MTHAQKQSDPTLPPTVPPRQILWGWAAPEAWKPFATFALAVEAVERARLDVRSAFLARAALSTPFLREGPEDQAYHYSFSRSADEAAQRCPAIPAELIEARREEERTQAVHEAVRRRLTVTPAYGADVLRKLRFITQQIDDVLSPDEASDVEEAFARPDEFPQTLEFLGLHDDIARAVAGSVTPNRDAWEAALGRWTEACDRKRPVVEADRLATMEVNRQAPPELQGRHRFQDYSAKWMNARALDNDVLLTGAAKARLRDAVVAWDKERSRLLAEKFGGHDDEAWTKLYDDADDAANALLDTAPPSLAELVLQQRIAAERIADGADDSEGGVDNLGWVSFNDESYWTDRPLTTLHRHTLRLAGIDHPILHMEPFSPRGWIKAYESTGLLVSDSSRGLILTVAPTPEADAVASRLRSELAATPWKYWAVHLSAYYRREEGGDPIFDACMGSGHNDNRGGGTRFFGPVQLADLVEFSRSLDGGAPVPHVTRIDNRGLD